MPFVPGMGMHLIPSFDVVAVGEETWRVLVFDGRRVLGRHRCSGVGWRGQAERGTLAQPPAANSSTTPNRNICVSRVSFAPQAFKLSSVLHVER